MGVLIFGMTLFLFNGNDQTRSSWLNCALRDDEALYWVSLGHYEVVAVGSIYAFIHCTKWRSGQVL